MREVPALFRALNPEQRIAAVGAVLLLVSTFGPFSFVEAAEVLTGSRRAGAAACAGARTEVPPPARRRHGHRGRGPLGRAADRGAPVRPPARPEPAGARLRRDPGCAGLRERAKRPPDDLPAEPAGRRPLPERFSTPERLAAVERRRQESAAAAEVFPRPARSRPSPSRRSPRHPRSPRRPASSSRLSEDDAREDERAPALPPLRRPATSAAAQLPACGLLSWRAPVERGSLPARGAGRRGRRRRPDRRRRAPRDPRRRGPKVPAALAVPRVERLRSSASSPRTRRRHGGRDAARRPGGATRCAARCAMRSAGASRLVRFTAAGRLRRQVAVAGSACRVADCRAPVAGRVARTLAGTPPAGLPEHSLGLDPRRGFWMPGEAEQPGQRHQRRGDAHPEVERLHRRLRGCRLHPPAATGAARPRRARARAAGAWRPQPPRQGRAAPREPRVCSRTTIRRTRPRSPPPRRWPPDPPPARWRCSPPRPRRRCARRRRPAPWP